MAKRGRKQSLLEDRVLNVVSDTPDFRDRMYEPALIQLKASLPAGGRLKILDQGREGACTGFGLAAVVNLLNARRGRRITVSPRMIYEMARKFDEWPGEGYAGSSCRGAIRGFYAMGACTDRSWPYKPDDRSSLTVRRAKEARENTLGAYYRVRRIISDFHAALNEAGALFVSASVHPGWGEAGDGVIPYRRQKDAGGHAFAIVGYERRGFIVQNSWGPRWGKRGLAVWTYEDWFQNLKDAWVLRLALPTPQIWHLRRPALPSGDDQGTGRTEATPSRTEIAGHFVHIDDGAFHDAGPFWSNEDDVRMTAGLLGTSEKYDHLLFYAHGGLNSVKASARRIAAMKPVFKANRIYPYHFMYDTGLMEEIRDVVVGKEREARGRVGAFSDYWDRFIEKVARRPGRALWREMKSGAESPFRPGGDGRKVLDIFAGALLGEGKPRLTIHLAGHSTGGILLAFLLRALEEISPALRISSCSLMAPAATLELYKSHYHPLLAAPGGTGIDRMTVYDLGDELEKDDTVGGVYRKSLLYLVSNAFEEERGAPLLGIRAHAAKLGSRFPRTLDLVVSSGGEEQRPRTASTTHGGFDNDRHTLNDILRTVLGRKRLDRPFRRSDLQY